MRHFDSVFRQNKGHKISCIASSSIASQDEVCNQKSSNKTQEISISHLESQIIAYDFEPAQPTPQAIFSSKS